ncbi:glycerate kinase [Candidatus Bathyarchaeota archaeon]|nr:glycerate kinase [Candidatus Bathyarchaeota archaeon]MBS7627637.1 glycerate kinase [Candidatus Bathyarchaeota archaeon]
MEILNKASILDNAASDKEREARRIALEVLKAGVEAVDPRLAVNSFVKRHGNVLKIGSLTLDLKAFDRILVVGGGKASGAMAEALEGILSDHISSGLVNVLRGTASDFRTQRIAFNEAGHPIPDKDGLEGSRKILELMRGLDDRTLVFCLISGGGSALMPLPATGISLEDKQSLTQILVNRTPATIKEVNAVRKHISAIKGGQLARAAYPATVVSLILSDIVGDPLDSIASGPTVPDTSTFRDAKEVLDRYGVWTSTPDSIKRRIEAGLRGEIPETPKPGDRIFQRVHNIIIGNNRLAAEAACRKAEGLGCRTLLLSSLIQGEARHVGTVYAGIMAEVLISGKPVERPAVIVAGGETTVTVTGSGKGGRNQELVLGASLALQGLKGVAIASIGTDGLDGPTDAAGAIADGYTIERARGMGLDPMEFLRNNDSYSFFLALKDLIFTGPTKTNVNDLAVLVIL